MIDDYRYLNIFIPVCNDLKIETTGYMHGRISKELKFQKPLMKFTFDRYYLWSNFFYKELLKLNPNYSKKKVLVYKKFENFKITKKKLRKKL